MSRRLSLTLGIKALVTGLILYLVFRRVDLHAVRALFSNIQAPFLAAALILLLPLGISGALRWRSVAAACGQKLRFGDALLFSWIGQFFNLGLPILGFDGTRAWKLHQSGVPLMHAARIVILDRVCALASLLIVIAFGLPRILSVWGEGWFPGAAVLAFAAGVSALAFLVLLRHVARFIPRLRPLKPFIALSEELNAAIRHRAAATALFWGVCNHLLRVGVALFMAYSLGVNLQPYDAFALVPVALLIAMVPISLGGWGIREVVFIAAFGLVGIASAEALGVSVLFGLTVLLTGLIGGVVWMFELRQPGKVPKGLQASSSAVTKVL